MKKSLLFTSLVMLSSATLANLENPFFLAERGRFFSKTTGENITVDPGEDLTKISQTLGVGLSSYTTLYANVAYGIGEVDRDGLFNPAIGLNMQVLPGRGYTLHLFSEFAASIIEEKNDNYANDRHALTFGFKLGHDYNSYAVAFVPSFTYNLEGDNNERDATHDSSVDINLKLENQFKFSSFSVNTNLFYEILSKESGDYNTLGFGAQLNVPVMNTALVSPFFDVELPDDDRLDSIVSMGLKFGFKL